jgi:dephospho-CoA kinase
MGPTLVIIGVAGGSGTGKSTVATHLARRLGGVHIDADLVAHGLLDGDGDVIEAVRERFGDEVFDDRGRVDRRALGARVFSDARQRRALNEIMHPAIRRVCGQLVEQARGSGAGAAVVDAALLLDSRMPFRFDLTIALRCPPETRFARIMKKGGRTAGEVRLRLASQRDLEKSFYKADAVIDTDGELKHVLAEVDRVVDAALKGPR